MALLGSFLRGLFSKGKPNEVPATATPALLSMLTRARNIQPSWTQGGKLLAKHHRTRLKRNQRTNRARALNRKRHPRSAHAF